MLDPESETETETEEEMETAENETNCTGSEDDDISIDVQPYSKSKKKSQKEVPKSNSLENTSKEIRRKKTKIIEKKKIDVGNEKDGKALISGYSQEGTSKRKAKMFDTSKVDVNLHHGAPQNIKVKTIQMNDSLMVMCHVIEGAEMKGYYNTDFAALTFQKKMKDGKAFEFSIPLALLPTLQDATQIMRDANPQFFAGVKKFNEK